MHRVTLILIFLLALNSSVHAQTPTATPAIEQANSSAAIAERIKEIGERIKRGRSDAAELDLESPAVQHMLMEGELLRSQLIELQRMHGEIAKREDLLALKQQTSELLGSEPNVVNFPADQQTFTNLESLRDDREIQRDEIENSASSVRELEDLLSDARDNYASAEARRRQLKEQVERASTVKPDQVWQLKVAELESTLALAKVDGTKMTLENERLAKEVAEARFALLDRQISALGKLVSFSQGDLEQITKKLKGESIQLQRDLDHRQQQLVDAEAKLKEAGPELAPEYVDLLREQRDQQQILVTLLSERLQSVVRRGTLWLRRLEFNTKTIERDTLAAWGKDAEFAAGEMSKRLDDLRVSATQLHNQLTRLIDREDEMAKSGGPELQWLKERQALKRLLIKAYDEAIGDIQRAKRLNSRLKHSIDEHIGAFSFQKVLSSAWAGVIGIWNYEIFSTADDYSITVKKLVLIIALFIIGFLLAGKMSAWACGQLATRLKLGTGAEHALERLSFYSLIIIFALIAFNWVGVPLTVFTVLGGAVAIGVGFGSQTILSNFISGLILLIERPIKVGDMIEVAGAIGTVQEIGTRSSIIRTGQNYDMIVPNSQLLEQNVTNLTLRDNSIRISVSVGVAYGTSPELVRDTLLQIAAEETAIDKFPEPFVIFSDFGDSALVFQLYGWMKLYSNLVRMKVESNLRFAIDRKFKEAGIVIAFPQRDLHIVEPVQIKMIQNG